MPSITQTTQTNRVSPYDLLGEVRKHGIFGVDWSLSEEVFRVLSVLSLHEYKAQTQQHRTLMNSIWALGRVLVNGYTRGFFSCENNRKSPTSASFTDAVQEIFGSFSFSTHVSLCAKVKIMRNGLLWKRFLHKGVSHRFTFTSLHFSRLYHFWLNTVFSNFTVSLWTCSRRVLHSRT